LGDHFVVVTWVVVLEPEPKDGWRQKRLDVGNEAGDKNFRCLDPEAEI